MCQLCLSVICCALAVLDLILDSEHARGRERESWWCVFDGTELLEIWILDIDVRPKKSNVLFGRPLPGCATDVYNITWHNNPDTLTATLLQQDLEAVTNFTCDHGTKDGDARNVEPREQPKPGQPEPGTSVRPLQQKAPRIQPKFKGTTAAQGRGISKAMR